MRNWILAATTLALAAGVPLAAQGANLGLAVTLGVPTGQLNRTSYPDGSYEGYNSALGMQFTASFPVDRTLALRVNANGMNFQGNAYDPTQPPVGGRTFSSAYSIFTLGGDAQIFLGDGNAMRHTGTYLIGGLGADFEHFDYSSDYNYAYSSISKTRMGLDVGLGHSFRYYGRWRWTLEATFHKTLTGESTGDSISNTGLPSADFFKVAWGMIF